MATQLSEPHQNCQHISVIVKNAASLEISKKKNVHAQYAICKLHCAPISERVFLQNTSHENQFDLHENELAGRTHFHMNELFCTKTRFDIVLKNKLRPRPHVSGYF